jgi:hypothetical protein
MPARHYAKIFEPHRQRSSCGVVFMNFSHPTPLRPNMVETPALVTCKRCRADLIKAGYMTAALYEEIDGK